MVKFQFMFLLLVVCFVKANAQLQAITEGRTHGSVERLFHQDKIYEWMFSYSKEEEMKRYFSKKRASWTPPVFKNEFIN